MKNWSLSKKIWGVLSLLAVAFAINVFLSLKNLGSVSGTMNEITSVVVKADQLTSDIQDLQRQLTITAFEVLVEQDTAKIEGMIKKFDGLLEDQKKKIVEFKAIATAEGDALAEKYEEAYAKWLVEAKKSQQFALNHHPKEAVETLIGANPLRGASRKFLLDLNDLTARVLTEKSVQANAIATQAFWSSLILSVSSILGSLVIAFFVLRSLTRSVQQIVSSLFSNSTEVSAAATQIAASSETLSQCATEQAASLEETAASIEEMSSMVKKTSENADSTSSTSTRSQEKAEQGKKVVEQMIQSMADINQSNNTIMEQVNESNNRIAEIVKVIEEIGNKTKVINDIVFQTKLLSFNASVEAARAGEHGKGFAVVAEEVGTLAEMSGNAAKEISALLDGSIQRVNGIVSETRTKVEKLITDGKATVESGTRVAKQCGEVLEEIVTNVSSVSHMSGEIASASEEQSRGVAEITKAMGQLDQVTQQNASTSEEAASAAEELSGQAESLKATVEQLVMVIDGAHAKTASAVRATKTAKAARTAAPKTATKATMKSAPRSEANKVVQLKPKATQSARAITKSAVGDGSVPSFDDDRFSDV